MSTTKHKSQERGIALLLTIFGLLLLTAIAAAMMFSSDTETSIAVNYRDKNSGTYAALSGLQEARDRLQPLHGDLSGYAALQQSLF
jgi:Tfp pilus assembly protein PilX